MPHSTKAATRRNSVHFSKPNKSFPVYPNSPTNPGARWCKKIRGKLHYFGKCADDPKGVKALELWLEQKDDLLAGRTPRAGRDGLTLHQLCNRFMAFKEGLLEAGELVQRSYDQYLDTCQCMLDSFGKQRFIDDLIAEDFEIFRATLTKRFGPVSLGNTIQRVRSVFKYGYEAGLIDKPPRFGPGFRKPSAKVLRKSKAIKGEQMFSAQQILAVLDKCMPNSKAMTLLAINGGLGNNDLARLPLAGPDLESGWLYYPRVKTGIPRRIPLWPETIDAIRESIEQRPNPVNPADAELLFIGRRGESYIGNSKGYRVAQEFSRAMKRAKIEGRTFYDLRRTFQTIGEGANDLVAVQAIMGHAPSSGDMSATYRQRIEDSRLRAVTDHILQWLYGEPAVILRVHPSKQTG